MTDLPGVEPLNPSEKDLGKAVKAMKATEPKSKKPLHRMPGKEGGLTRGIDGPPI